MMTEANKPYRWAKPCLIAAGVYNIVWGAAVIIYPNLLFDFADMEPPKYPQIWQCVGMIVGVYGIGYIIAARNYRTHWPIILVGFLGKVFGPIGFVSEIIQRDLPLMFGATIITNDLIWWIPFTLILWDAAKHRGKGEALDVIELNEALDAVSDQHGQTLRAITDEKPTLAVLTRHAGCTFCKETITDLKAQREAIEREGVAIVVVSMSAPQTLAEQARKYSLENIGWISDPQRLTYSALELKRGNFMQLFGPFVWWRGLIATLRGHLPGKLDGDGFQMSGSFVLHHGKVIKAYRHKTAADRVDHADFVCNLSAQAELPSASARAS